MFLDRPDRTSPRTRAPRMATMAAFVLLSTIVTANPAAADQRPTPAPTPAEPEARIASSEDDTLVEEQHVDEETIGDSEVARFADDPGRAPRGTKLNVEVHGPNLHAVRVAILDVDGEIFGSVPGFFVEARIPIEHLEDLNAASGVTRVASLTRASSSKPKSLQANPLVNTIENTLQMKPWHDVGHTGAGQKIGILDIFGTEELEDAIAQGRLPAPAGAFCQDSGRACSITLGAGGPHGVAVAELIHRTAPDAELYFASVTTLGDLRAAIDWFGRQGVTVINRSETSEFDGPGDGTGPTAALVERAVELDMVWVTAAGNAAGSADRPGQNWIGQFNDPDGNGFHNWADGSERMGFTCGFIHGMRWDDWDSTSIATDYDIWIYDDEDDRKPEAKGDDNQNEVAHRPLEHIDTRCSGPTDRDYLAIRRFGDPQPDGPDTIQILGNLTPFDEWVNTSAATGPGTDSRSTGAITVGATTSPSSLELASYSSHGPTIDGRNGIDLLGPSCFKVTEFNFCFSGTSASAPVVTGVVAVLRGANVIEIATDAESVVPLITEDLGEPGPDALYGHGSLRMPPPALLGARTYLPSCNGVPATLVGTSGNDVLVGTDKRDVIVSGPGDDTISGLGGDDLICSGFGNDRIDGGLGNDTIVAGPGADVVRGSDGDDFINGGHGHDNIEGNSGNDELRGFKGRDYVKGGLGEDLVYGGAGNDRLVGGKGTDELFGGNGVDRCRGETEIAISCRS